MAQEIKIEKKSSDVVQPQTEKEARQSIRDKQDLSGAPLRGMMLNNLNTVGSILRKTDLTWAMLSHGLFVNANFYRASLYQAGVNNTIFMGGDLVKTSFKEADLSESVLLGVDAENASFEGANLRGAALVRADLEDANFTGANLTDARLASCDVTNADFTDADLSGARAYHIDWSKAKVPPAILPDPLIELPRWALPVLIGGALSSLSLLIYLIIRKNKSKSEPVA